MSHLEFKIGDLLEAGLAGWLHLFASAALILLAIALVARILTKTARRPLRSFRRASFVAAAACALVAAPLAVMLARAHAVAAALVASPTPDIKPIVEALEHAESALYVASAAALVAGPLLAVAAILARIRAPRRARASARRLLPWAMALLTTELVCAVALGVIRRAAEIGWSCCCGGVGCLALCRRSEAEDAAEILDAARVHILIVAVIGVLLLARASRCLRPLGRSNTRMETACVALFGAGLVAFLATRAMAFDARSLLPVIEETACVTETVDDATLPHAPWSEPVWYDFVVELLPTGAAVYEKKQLTPDELSVVLRDKRMLWEMLQGPNKPLHPVTIAASSDTPVRAIAPWLSVIMRATRPEARILIRRPPVSTPTRTLGPVPSTPRCAAVDLRLDQLDDALARDLTWGDLTVTTLLR